MPNSHEFNRNRMLPKHLCFIGDISSFDLGNKRAYAHWTLSTATKPFKFFFFCYILLHIRFTRGANRTFKKKVSSVTWVRNCCLCDSFVLCSDTGATILAIMNDWFNLYFWVRRAFSLRISGFKPFVIRLLLGEEKESNIWHAWRDLGIT